MRIRRKIRETVLEDRAGRRTTAGGGGITEEVSFEQMRAMYQAMKDADARYDEN